MAIEHHVAFYIVIGILIYLIGSFSPDAQKTFDDAVRRGPGSIALVSLGMVVGVILWPIVLMSVGIKAAIKARTKCEMCGRRGVGRNCPRCRELVGQEARKELAQLREKLDHLEQKAVAGEVAYAVPYIPIEPPPRRFVCEMPCPTCNGHAVLYEGDYRCPGLLRVECDAGHWGDLGPESILIPEPHRRSDL